MLNPSGCVIRRFRLRQRLFERCACGEMVVVQDFLQQRAGVFRIGVDIAAQQCVPQHSRAAQLASVLGIGAGGLRGLPEQFAEYHRFGEHF